MTDLKNMSTQDLHSEVAASKKELFNLSLSVASGQVKDSSQFKKLRKKIARALTYLNMKQKEGGK